jgi:hypothetical protein
MLYLTRRGGGGLAQTMQYRTPASNGQYYVGNMPYPQYQQQQRTMPPPVPEQTQRTSTIRNDVNLKKSSLRVTRDPSVRAPSRGSPSYCRWNPLVRPPAARKTGVKAAHGASPLFRTAHTRSGCPARGLGRRQLSLAASFTLGVLHIPPRASPQSCPFLAPHPLPCLSGRAQNPDVLLVSFSFDASAPCAVSVFFDVEELVRDSCRLAVGPSVLPPSARTTFDKGLSQKFIVAAPDGLLRSSVPSAVLFKPEAGRFPLVVRPTHSPRPTTSRRASPQHYP